MVSGDTPEANVCYVFDYVQGVVAAIGRWIKGSG